MSSIEKIVMERFYRQAAGDPKCLPLHRDTPSKTLMSVVGACKGRGRALDVGCGAGVFSIWLAEKGMDVTGIDLFPEAIKMARSLVKENTKVEFVNADLFRYAPEQPFDLIFDSGCLHSLVGGDEASYKRMILLWLVAGGNYAARRQRLNDSSFRS